MNWKQWKMGIGVALVIGIFTACAAGATLDGIQINLKFFLFFIGLIGKDVILFLKEHPVQNVNDDPPSPLNHVGMLLFCGLLAFGVGCSFSQKRLEVGGAYAPAATNLDGTVTATAAPDMTLFLLDSTYDYAYQATLTAFRLEKDNRALLSKTFPDLKQQMDQAREAVWKVDGDWARAREAYLANPIPANLDAINRALAEIQRWNATATALLPKK